METCLFIAHLSFLIQECGVYICGDVDRQAFVLQHERCLRSTEQDMECKWVTNDT